FPSQSHDLHIASESSPMHKTSHPFLFNTPAPAHLYTLSLHDALPISPQFGKPFGKLPFDKKPNPAQSSMRLGEIRTNRDGLLGIPFRRSPGVRLLLGVQLADEGPRFRTLRVRQGVIRIESECLIKEGARLAIILHISPCEIKVAFKI